MSTLRRGATALLSIAPLAVVLFETAGGKIP
jgi:hypothetical protein